MFMESFWASLTLQEPRSILNSIDIPQMNSFLKRSPIFENDIGNTCVY